MSNPQVLDFTAEPEDAITIRFPKAKGERRQWSCELPTLGELNMATYQWIAAKGDEWQTLFATSEMTPSQFKRWDHLNSELVYKLCDGVPPKVVDRLSAKQKAKVIMGFMNALPENWLDVINELVAEDLRKLRKGKAKATSGTSPSSSPA